MTRLECVVNTMGIWNLKGNITDRPLVTGALLAHLHTSGALALLQDVAKKTRPVCIARQKCATVSRVFASVCASMSLHSRCLPRAVYTDWNHYYQLQLGTAHHNIPHNNYCYSLQLALYAPQWPQYHSEDKSDS